MLDSFLLNGELGQAPSDGSPAAPTSLVNPAGAGKFRSVPRSPKLDDGFRGSKGIPLAIRHKAANTVWSIPRPWVEWVLSAPAFARRHLR